MSNTRRGFLGTVAAVLAMPAVGNIVPAVSAGRGMTKCIFHVDEFAFQTPITGKSGQILVVGENGPEWQYACVEWVLSKGPNVMIPIELMRG